MMDIEILHYENEAIAVVETREALITDAQSALDFIATVRYETGCDAVLISKEAIGEAFFDLKSRVAGEVAQKFVNYRMRLGIVGDLAAYQSKSLRDFVYECNQGRTLNFSATRQEALARLTGKRIEIVVLDGYVLNPGDLSWSGLEKLGKVTVYERTKADEILERIGGAQLVFTNKTPITRETLAACPNLKFVGVLATGYNVVDVAAAREFGVVVTNVPNYGTQAVAQFTIALLLELCHRIGAHSDSVMRGEWQQSSDWCYWHYPLIELSGKTMGIIGYGKIGKETGKIAEALGMRVMVMGQTPRSGSVSELTRYADLDEILTQSDVLVLHCPLTEENGGLICSQTLAKMKEGILIVNTARGGLVVEADLRVALESGKVAGYACDVVSVEPIQADNPLLGAPNTVITPHIAWASKESRQRLMDIAVSNAEAFLANAPIHVVG